MDTDTKQAIDTVLTNSGLTDEEKKLIDFSNTAITKDMNYTNVLSTFLLTNQLKVSTLEIIKSNQELAKSESYHAKWMRYLTFSLVFVGSVQVVLAAINLFS